MKIFNFVQLFTLSFLIFFSSSYANDGFALRQEAREKNIDLSENDLAMLEIGEISTARYITGGVLGTYPLGLGIGHAVQGTWDHRGWIFTAGQLTSLAAILIGANECDFSTDSDSNCNNGLAAAGVLSYLGFRIWEIVDVWSGVPRYEAKYRSLKEYIRNKDSKIDQQLPAKPKVSFIPVYSSEMNQLGMGIKVLF